MAKPKYDKMLTNVFRALNQAGFKVDGVTHNRHYHLQLTHEETGKSFALTASSTPSHQRYCQDAVRYANRQLHVMLGHLDAAAG